MYTLLTFVDEALVNSIVEENSAAKVGCVITLTSQEKVM